MNYTLRLDEFSHIAREICDQIINQSSVAAFNSFIKCDAPQSVLVRPEA